MPRQTRKSRRGGARRPSTRQSTPLQSDPAVGVPGVTGDLVADYGVPVDIEEPVEEEEALPSRYRSRYLAQRERSLESPVARRRTPDHRYVVGEITRIAIIGSLMLAILVVATLLLR